MYLTIVVGSLLFGASCAADQPMMGSTHLPNTYYVSPSGSDSNSGSSSSPFKSIQKAVDIVNAGDTVIVRNGVYSDTNKDSAVIKIKKGGTSKKWIVFRSENKWGAVLDCQNNTVDYAIHSISADSSYIAFENFEIKGCKKMAAIFNLGEHDISFKGNYIHDIARHLDNTLIGFPAIYAGSGSRYTFDSNIFHTIGRLNPHTTPSASEASCTTPSNYVFKGRSYPSLNACYNHDHALYLVSTNNEILNNIFYDLKSGWAVMSGGSGDLIINNTFIGDNPGRLGQILVKKTGTTIANNIFFNDNDCGIFAHSWDCGGTIKNNIFYPDIDVLCDKLASPRKGAWTISDNILNQDPKFRSAINYDFHLKPDSPARSRGDVTVAPVYDRDGKKRAKEGRCDIGAYEY